MRCARSLPLHGQKPNANLARSQRQASTSTQCYDKRRSILPRGRDIWPDGDIADRSTSDQMTTTIFLSALPIPARQAVLEVLETVELRSIYGRNDGYGAHKMIDLISNNEETCSQVELTIQHNGHF